MTINVIGAGFGRAGTGSLRAALEILGYTKCYHMFDIIFEDSSKAKAWHKASKGEEINWDDVFEGYLATVDWPGSSFYKELVEKYPDAKVILTVRDPDKWYQSMSDTIYTLSESFPKWLSLISPKMKNIIQMVYSVIWDGTFNGEFKNKAYAKEIFNKHIEEVKGAIPSDHLLVYQVTEGWEPLCTFLGVNIPEDQPFPHINDTEELKKAGRRMLLISKLQPVVVIIMLVLLLVYIFA